MTSQSSLHRNRAIDLHLQDDRERRKSSADNLERLYTIVAGLCLATAVGRLLNDGVNQPGDGAAYLLISNVQLRYEVAPMFVALIARLLPFYHGANRYLFDTYVLGTSGLPSSLGAMLDFAFFFMQALLFYAMALVTANGAAFYTLLVAVLLLDCVWSLLALIGRRANWSNAQLWLLLNTITSTLLVGALIAPWWSSGFQKWTWLAAVALVRTVIDYVAGRAFYWPGLTLWSTEVGAPRSSANHSKASHRVPHR